MYQSWREVTSYQQQANNDKVYRSVKDKSEKEMVRLFDEWVKKSLTINKNEYE